MSAVNRYKVRLAGTVLAVALLGGGTGCTGPDHTIERAQVVGIWKADDGGRIEFTADGRFAMSGIHREAETFSFSDPPPAGERLTGAGTWELEHQRFIELSYEKGGSFSDTETGSMGIAETGKDPVLYFSTDSDKEYGYEVRKVS
ncbi:hypothetical protein [Streptomyces bacillaris]|uniref:hypothetical protein n=1 Tax=Streptomyces bacillaris TaxID=68179 RepID=UPI003467EA80